MSCGLPREVLKWILSLDLSYAVKNPKRDFANGFLYAEILSRYYPADVQMHSFENVASMERKKSNWALLEKVIKRKRIPIERAQIEAVMAAEGDVAVEVLQTIFNFIHSPSYEASKAQSGPGPSPERAAAAQARDRGYEASTSGQPDFVPLPTAYDQQHHHHHQQQQLYGQIPGAMYFGGGAGGGRRPAGVVGGGGGADYDPSPQGGNQPMYQQVAMGLQQQQQQLQQVAGNGYGGYAQAQPQYSGPGPVVPSGGYGYGYGHLVSQPGPGPVGYASQMQQQQQQYPAPSQGRSTSPGRSGLRPQQHQAAAAPAPEGSSMAAAAPVAAGGGYAAAYALAYAEQMRQQAVMAGYNPDQQQLIYQQALYQYQQQVAAVAMGAAAAAAGGSQVNAPNGPIPGAQGSPEREGLPYSRKPRPVDYKPYDIKDFEDKEYNVKAGRGYWQLGKLGPDLETEELQAKREAKERVKKLAEQVREENARRANSRIRQRPADSAGAPGSSGAAAAGGGGGGGGAGGGSNSAGSITPVASKDKDKDKELSARERALQFAKNIPKPEVKPKKQPAASLSGEAADEPPVLSELELLEKQHQERQQQVDKIRAELARIL